MSITELEPKWNIELYGRDKVEPYFAVANVSWWEVLNVIGRLDASLTTRFIVRQRVEITPRKLSTMVVEDSGSADA